MKISGREIGPNCAPYVIAELSGNHMGQIDRARAMLDAVKEAGADAAKLQTYRADTITLKHDGPEFRIEGGLWAGRTLYDLYEEAHTPWEWHEPLFAHAKDIGLTLFSSPFDPTAVDLLERLETPAYKIASFELVDIPLIEMIAGKGKPVILSTGLATLAEIQEAVDAVRNAGNEQIILLHCISGYPTPIEEANVRTIPDMMQKFDVAIGLSDHTLGTAAAAAAVACGAQVIEKHFTLSRADGGPDAAFSLEPMELKVLVDSVKDVWSALGHASYDLKPSETGGREFRRSLYVMEDVPAGTKLTEKQVRSIRPGLGLAPKHLSKVLGRKAVKDLKKGEPFSLHMIGEDT